MLTDKQRKRLARAAVKRSASAPVTHTGRRLHPFVARLAAMGGGHYYDAESVRLDSSNTAGGVLAFVPVPLFLDQAGPDLGKLVRRTT